MTSRVHHFISAGAALEAEGKAMCGMRGGRDRYPPDLGRAIEIHLGLEVT